MDEKVYKVVDSLNKGDKSYLGMSVTHLIQQHGLQAVSEAEESGYITSTDNVLYYITASGEFLLLTSIDNEQLSTSFSWDRKELTILLNAMGDKMEIELKVYDSSYNFGLYVTVNDNTWSHNNASLETLDQLINILTMFRDDVLNTKEDTAGED